MTRYFRLLQDTFLWNAGAVISNEEDEEQYTSINRALDRITHDEYISSYIVEDVINAEFFQEVYPFETGQLDEEEEPVMEYKDTEQVKTWQHSAFSPKKQ